MIYIDYRPGTHGTFLEFVCNAYLAKLSLPTLNVINDPYIFHTMEYMQDRKFRADTYALHTLLEKRRLGLVVRDKPSYIRNTHIIRVMPDADDLLPLLCTVFSTPAHNGCMPENLEINTYNKMSNNDHQLVLDDLNMHFNDGHLVESYNNVKAEEWPMIETVEEFFQLPIHIKKECEETFNIKPYRLSKETPDCPRHVLLDYFKNAFLHADNLPWITDQYMVSYHDSNTIFKFPYSSFLSKDKFLNEIYKVAEWCNYEVNYEQELKDLYDDFTAQHPYLNVKLECDNIVNQINNNESCDLSNLNVICEAYISTKIDKEIFQ